MATVYLAEDLKHHRKVAVKVLHPELSAVLGAERFLKEIELTASLQHPHILPLFESGDAHGRLFYVMPYVDGETLRDRLTREHQLPVGDVVRIASDVADALDYAHRHGVIHRDIKPENILLRDGRAVVADFGIALAVQHAGGARMTQTGMSLGTPQYMSPEQAMGERTLDARTDIYALGAVCYEMLVGEAPFNAPTVQGMIAKTVTETPRPMAPQRHTVPPHVEAAVRMALEKLPADRFATAGQFAEALGGKHSAVSAGSTATSRRPRLVSILAAATAGVLGLAIGFAAASRGGREGASREVRQWNIALPDSAPLAFFGESPLGIWQTAVAISRNGETFAYVARRGSTTQLYLRRKDDQIVRPLAGTAGAFHPFFSPDGNWIGYFVGSELRKMPVAGGPSVVLGRFWLPLGASWGSNDSILVPDAEGVDPLLVPADGGAPRKLRVDGSRGRLRQPHVLPDGKFALVTLGGFAGGSLGTISLEDGRLFALTKRGMLPSDSVAISERLPGRNPHYVSSGHLVYVTGDGVLMAVAFDAAARRLRGDPTPVFTGVRTEETYGFGQFDVADDGTLVYAPGRNASIGVVGLVNEDGRVDTLALPPGEYYNLSLDPAGTRAIAQRRTGALGSSFDVVLIDLERENVQVLLAGEIPLAWWPGGDSVILTRGGRDSVSSFVLSGGRRRPLPGWMRAVRGVSPDGQWLAASDSFFVRLVPGTDTSLAVSLGPGSFWMSFSPNGRWLAFPAVGSDGGIVLARVPFDGRRRQISSDNGEQPRWTRRGIDSCTAVVASSWWSMLTRSPARSVDRVSYSLGHSPA